MTGYEKSVSYQKVYLTRFTAEMKLSFSDLTLKIPDSVSHAPRLNLSYDLLTVNELRGITMTSPINNPHTPYI